MLLQVAELPSLYGWVISLCVCVRVTFSLSIHLSGWTLRLFPCLGCCIWCWKLLSLSFFSEFCLFQIILWIRGFFQAWTSSSVHSLYKYPNIYKHKSGIQIQFMLSLTVVTTPFPQNAISIIYLNSQTFLGLCFCWSCSSPILLMSTSYCTHETFIVLLCCA